MGVKGNRGVVTLRTVFLLVFLCTIFTHSFSEPNFEILDLKNNTQTPPGPASSTIIFPIQGNVYPIGVYTVNLNIGKPPKTYNLDIDSGSDLTWIQCDNPCRGCTLPRNKLYKPNGNVATCADPLCNAVKPRCSDKKHQCDYQVEYTDGSSKGVLVRDSVILNFRKGPFPSPNLALGCGYDQQYHGSDTSAARSTAGVLGLGNGKSSILSQLVSSGLIRNVVGHCLSSNGGGFIFLGDIPLPPGVVWTPISRSSSSSQQHYSSGPADLFFNGKPTPAKGLQVIFDSGSTYTYLNSKSLKVVVDLVKNDVKGKLSIVKDPALPNCWKGQKPFKSVADVRNYFKPLTLSFTTLKNTLLQMPPEAYLIITNNGNACLGILDSAAEGLGTTNLIGDISLQDKLVIYDNEKQQIGWVPGTCKKSPSS